MFLREKFPELYHAIRQVVPPSVQIHMVGGAVRDILLNHEIKDFDFVVAGLVRPIGKKIAAVLKAKYFILDDVRDVVRIVLPNLCGKSTNVDLCLMNGATLEEDLANRDFTIDAIAVEINETETVYDPLGGATDLLDKKLRMCNLYSLKDDPLRSLRAIRMSLSFNLRFDGDLVSAMQEIRPMLNMSAYERYREELVKIFSLRKNATAAELMRKFGFTEILFSTDFFPKNELIPLLRSADHIIQVLTLPFDEELCNNLNSALLVCKLGQTRDRLHEFMSTWRILPDDNREIIIFSVWMKVLFGADEMQIRTICKHLTLSNDAANAICKTIQAAIWLHSRKNQNKLSAVEKLHFFQQFENAGISGVLLFLSECFALYASDQSGENWPRLIDLSADLYHAYFDAYDVYVKPVPLLSGERIMEIFNLKPGPAIGRIRQHLMEAQANGLICCVQDAVDYVKTILSESD